MKVDHDWKSVLNAGIARTDCVICRILGLLTDWRCRLQPKRTSWQSVIYLLFKQCGIFSKHSTQTFISREVKGDRCCWGASWPSSIPATCPCQRMIMTACVWKKEFNLQKAHPRSVMYTANYFVIKLDLCVLLTPQLDYYLQQAWTCFIKLQINMAGVTMERALKCS